MTPNHAGVQLFPMNAVCFRMLQFRMSCILGVIEHTALYGQNPDTRYAYVCVTRRKQHRPGIAPNANTTHVPTAGSSAALTKPNHTPTRHLRAKGKILLQMVTPHAA